MDFLGNQYADMFAFYAYIVRLNAIEVWLG